MTVILVDYLVARQGPPPRRGLAYDYIVAGDGVYLMADNDWLDVCVPVTRCTIRGLPTFRARCVLRKGRVPTCIWQQVVQVSHAWAARGCEVLLAVTYSEAYGYRMSIPVQAVASENIVYQPAANVVLEIHSHHRYAARFSSTDDNDEQRLRVYGVVGRLNREVPEVALRVGAYGHFMPVAWETVFDGDQSDFRDAFYHQERSECL
jgi:PRTRC genetic system protein A